MTNNLRPDQRNFLTSLSKALKKMVIEAKELEDYNTRLREALEYGHSIMMKEIHAQQVCWPGEVDTFEDLARKALEGTE